MYKLLVIGAVYWLAGVIGERALAQVASEAARVDLQTCRPTLAWYSRIRGSCKIPGPCRVARSGRA